MKKLLLVLALLAVPAFAQTPTQISGSQIKNGAIEDKHLKIGAGIGFNKINFTGATPALIGAESPLTFTSPLVRTDNAITLGPLPNKAIVTKSASYISTTSDYSILCNATGGAIVIMLPTAATSGQELRIKKIDASANTVTISADGGATIDGETTVTISSQWSSYTVQYNGTNWFIF
jgi:hypothetical protein